MVRLVSTKIWGGRANSPNLPSTEVRRQIVEPITDDQLAAGWRFHNKAGHLPKMRTIARLCGCSFTVIA
jgi:hypothetical protein